MKKIVNLFIILSISLAFSGCTDKELRAVNRALHDANVEMRKENRRNQIAQRCQSGYYHNNYGAGKHYRMCGGPYLQQVPSTPILYNY